MNSITISIIVVGLIIGGAIIFTRPNSSMGTIKNIAEAPATHNVSVLGNDQIIEITAKGGYAPKVSEAKADLPTILRMKTQSTYDCTASINIPTLNIRKILPANGTTDIPLPPQKLGTSITVLCGMGMYNTVINFN